MIMPVTLSVITSSFPIEERAKAVGTWSGFAGAGGILGLFVSSFLIDRVSAGPGCSRCRSPSRLVALVDDVAVRRQLA